MISMADIFDINKLSRNFADSIDNGKKRSKIGFNKKQERSSQDDEEVLLLLLLLYQGLPAFCEC